jgi:BlaI family penicillinase repressor
VRTLLHRLEKKGAITHDVEGRTFIFRPLKKQEDVLRNGTHELIEYLFGGSPAELISHLLDHEHFTPQQKETFRAILEKLAKE